VPITIVPAEPGGIVGPGIGLQLDSDFIGPLPSLSSYIILITTIPEEQVVWEERVLWNSGNRTYWLGTKTQGGRTDTQTTSPAPGKEVAIDVLLDDTTGTVDTGSATATWQPTVGLGAQIALTPTSSGTTSPDPRIDQILAAVIRRLEDQR
jgi:hypothetical protein